MAFGKRIGNFLEEREGLQKTVLQFLKKPNYSLDVVNRYKENLLHVCAANDCLEILKKLVEDNTVEHLQRKNAFGWTPLMQAIRNENVEIVEYLLSNGALATDFTYLGLSVLSLAAAISTEMFDLVYKSCSSALKKAGEDDINPLCIAALKNDKELFFKLIDLGLDYTKANPFTQIMMKRSRESEISELVKSSLISEKYWNDLSNIENLLKDDEEEAARIIEASRQKRKESIKESFMPQVVIELANTKRKASLKHFKSRLSLPLILFPEDEPESLISPTLAYIKDTNMPRSPVNACFVDEGVEINPQKKLTLNFDKNIVALDPNNNRCSPSYHAVMRSDYKSPVILKRLQDIRPPNLNVRRISPDLSKTPTFGPGSGSLRTPGLNISRASSGSITPRCSPAITPNSNISKTSTDSDRTLSYTPRFTPPNLGTPNVKDDQIFDESTPTPPKYNTPPRVLSMSPSQAKLHSLLKKCGLQKYMKVFLLQEVDLDVFTTCNDQDLKDIGIEDSGDRLTLLKVIDSYKSRHWKQCLKFDNCD